MADAWTEGGPTVIGIDIGGTKTSAARVTRDGRLVGEPLVARTPANDGPSAVLHVAQGLVERLMPGAPVLAIGLGSAGAFSPAGHVTSATSHLAGWIGTDVAGRVRATTGVPVAVLNDVHAAGLGEARHGAGRGAARLLMVTVGTGIGGAVILDGRPDHGAHGLAGSVGHLPAYGLPARRCSCGADGHLEPWSSGPGLAQTYLEATRAARDVREIGLLAADGEPEAVASVGVAAGALGTGLAAAAAMADPDLIVIGGGVAELGEALLAPVRESFRRHALPPLRETVIRRATLGVTATLVGAAAAGWDLVGGGAPRG